MTHPRINEEDFTKLGELLAQAASLAFKAVDKSPIGQGDKVNAPLVEVAHFAALMLLRTMADAHLEHAEGELSTSRSATRLQAHIVLDDFLDRAFEDRRSVDDGELSTLILRAGLYNSEAFGFETEIRDNRGAW